jgi:hypothetical protein
VSKAKTKPKGLTAKSNFKESKTKEMAKATFKPVDPLTVRNADERYSYRWLNKAKLAKNGGQNADGWEVDTSFGDNVEKAENKGFLDSSHSVDGTVTSGDLILARMPKERAEARNEYYQKKQKKKEEIMSAKNRLGDQGTVSFESRKGRNVESY